MNGTYVVYNKLKTLKHLDAHRLLVTANVLYFFFFFLRKLH